MLGLNAQDANLPYLALWSRLDSFAIKDLTAAIEDRSLVRSTLMRATQHVMSVPDFRLVRPALEPLLRRGQRNAFGRRTRGVDLDALVADAAATWTKSRTEDAVELAVQPFRPLSPTERDAIEAEADRLLAFTDPDAPRRIQMLRPQ